MLQNSTYFLTFRKSCPFSKSVQIVFFLRMNIKYNLGLNARNELISSTLTISLFTGPSQKIHMMHRGKRTNLESENCKKLLQCLFKGKHFSNGALFKACINN